MKVKETMTATVQTCRPDTDLGAVAGMMWNRDCGCIPVVDAAGAVIGVVTDRDICIAAATRRLPPEHISAAQAMSAPPHACLPDDSILEALATMKHFQVRRLPVIDSNGVIRGIISVNDIARVTEQRRAIPLREVVSTLVAIC